MPRDHQPDDRDREHLLTVRVARRLLRHLPGSVRTPALFALFPFLVAEAAVRGGSPRPEGPRTPDDGRDGI